jgi:hypothetical protein
MREISVNLVTSPSFVRTSVGTAWVRD